MGTQKCETCERTGDCEFETCVKELIQLLGEADGTSFVPGCVARRFYEKLGGCHPHDPDTAAEEGGDANTMDRILGE